MSFNQELEIEPDCDEIILLFWTNWLEDVESLYKEYYDVIVSNITHFIVESAFGELNMDVGTTCIRIRVNISNYQFMNKNNAPKTFGLFALASAYVFGYTDSFEWSGNNTVTNIRERNGSVRITYSSWLNVTMSKEIVNKTLPAHYFHGMYPTSFCLNRAKLKSNAYALVSRESIHFVNSSFSSMNGGIIPRHCPLLLTRSDSGISR